MKNKLIKLSRLLYFVLILNIYLILISYQKIKNKNLYDIFSYKYSINKESQKIINKNDINFNISNIEYLFNYKLKVLEIKYSISFYNKKNKLIKPTKLQLLNEIHVICSIKDINSGIYIDSLANINKNINFICVEHINIKEKIELGIKLYKSKNNIELFFLPDKIINYNKIKKLSNKFNNLIIINNYINKLNKIKKNKYKLKDSYKLTKSYFSEPSFYTKINLSIKHNQWIFYNIFNNYYCFCKGKNCLKYINKYQKCKYKFYLYIIDNNKCLYNKTDYLLVDFLFKDIEPIDGYPIFIEMIRQNLSAHYMTKDDKIFKEFCLNKKDYCLYNFSIIYERGINGDFLEKYLEIILKLKVVIGVDRFNSLDNLFYNIEYITYIFLGHGVSYFKEFLYKDYLNYKKYDKIIIPPSNITISIAKKYGWKEQDIIKICLPRWDNYNIKNNYISKNKSIFIMFTWRKIKNGKTLSKYYINNTINLLKNKKLNKLLKKNNIKLFFTYHHTLKVKKKIILKDYPNISIIKQTKISFYLKESNLLITDFSSIVFDFIYQKKPFILYVPDSEDPNLKGIYIKPYYDIINGLKNGSIYFENKFFNINQVIEKIIYYINHKFQLDKKLKYFYRNFKFNQKNNTNNLINYLKKI